MRGLTIGFLKRRYRRIEILDIMKYPKGKAGEAIRLDLATEDLRLACCDCGSVHTFQFHHIKGATWDFAIYPEKRRTGQLRRHNYGYLQQEGRLR